MLVGARARSQRWTVAMEPLVLHAAEGLCARLSAILSYRLVAIAENRALYVIWTADAACEGHFLDHFEPLEDVRFVEPEDAPQNGIVVERTIDFHDLVRHHGGREAHCFADLKPRPDVAAAVDANVEEVGSDAVAVHIRRTDHFAQACDRVHPTDDAEFDCFADAHSGARIFLATDNAATRQRFIARHGVDRVSVGASLLSTPEGDGAPLRHSSLRCAVVDLLTCARCRVFKGSAYSSFSDAIAHVRRASGIAHADDEHEPSALWALQLAPSDTMLLARPGRWCRHWSPSPPGTALAAVCIRDV